jgi:predicted helicase
MGLAEEGLTVLDPAVGTGTFLWLVYLSSLVELKDKGLSGLIRQKIKKHILKDFYGFELLITPYIIAHLKLTTVLRKWFYEFGDDDRIQVYLTNTLEPFEKHTHMPFFRELTEESETADDLKLKKPVLVVLGNPPYSRSSSNKSDWIMEKVQDYKANLHERNIQPLDDDYIKFVRFAQWKVDQNGEGVVAFITNNRFLDALIHRKMRKSLLDSFGRIYLLNLHGSAREMRGIPEGDENVFDIQQGVAISIFIKKSGIEDKKICYGELCCGREEKYSWLDRNTTNTVQWQEIRPEEPYYFFVPKDFALKSEYSKFYAIDEIFLIETIGVTTHRDNFVVDFTAAELTQKLDLLRSDADPEEIKAKLHLKDTKNWGFKKAREAFKQLDYSKYLFDYAYRPFDTRKICYTPLLIDRTRERIMTNMLSDDTRRKRNISLILPKILLSSPFSVFVTDHIADKHLLTVKDDSFHVFPLYLRSKGDNEIFPSNQSEVKTDNVWTPNFTKKFTEFLQQHYEGNAVTPEQVIGYIYAMLHSPTYRDTYDEFLKIDFPRINFVEDYAVFNSLAEVGMRLINLQLLKTRLKTATSFDEQGSNVVKLVRYEEGKIYINKTQFFGGIPQDAWAFYLGSYQVLDKWLKSRKGRELSSSEIEHFLQIVEIIKKTIEYMKEIDGIHFQSI